MPGREGGGVLVKALVDRGGGRGSEKAGLASRSQGVLGMLVTQGPGGVWDPGPAPGSHRARADSGEQAWLLTFGLPQAFLGKLVSEDTSSRSPESLSPPPQETRQPRNQLSAIKPWAELRPITAQTVERGVWTAAWHSALGTLTDPAPDLRRRTPIRQGGTLGHGPPVPRGTEEEGGT